MNDVGVRAQTIKSFIVEHDQATAAGEKPDYRGQLFLIDESSMAGNQDTAALFQAIANGGGRAVSMGDIDQFESVDVGAPFKLMQERSPMDVAIMKQIVRQKDVQLRGAVHDIIDNRIDAALTRIEAQPADRVARTEGNAASQPLSGNGNACGRYCGGLDWTHAGCPGADAYYHPAERRPSGRECRYPCTDGQPG
jgi:ATP-dependent exoDNAse (exonuclease V) alpha subunit